MKELIDSSAFKKGIKNADKALQEPTAAEIELMLKHYYDFKEEMKYRGRDISEETAYAIIKLMIEDDQITSLGIRSIEFFFKHLQEEDLEMAAELKKKLEAAGIQIQL